MASPSLSMRRGRPIKYPRPADCPHLDRPEHANGVCYQCSSNINNQRKREKKLEDGSMPEPPKRRRRKNDDEYDEDFSDFVELNIGGKIFATTYGTLNREMSLLSVLLFGGHGTQMSNFARFDKQGRLFIDRDPTFFRWILNYLRDGYLVTIPSEIHERLQILQEARYYSLNSLASIISNPHQTQQVHPQILHAQAIARAQQAHAYQLHLMQAHLHQQMMLEEQKKQEVAGSELKKENPGQNAAPTFLTARPSTRGIFYLSEGKWQSLFPDKPWHNVAVKFEDASDEISFLSLQYALQTDPNGAMLPSLLGSEDLSRCKLQISETAKTVVDLSRFQTDPSTQLVATAEFWWEPSQSQYPQLFARVARDNTTMVSGPMDFIRTEPEAC